VTAGTTGAISPRINPARWQRRHFLGGTHSHVREFGLDLLQHPRQHDGEREAGWVQ